MKGIKFLSDPDQPVFQTYPSKHRKFSKTTSRTIMRKIDKQLRNEIVNSNMDGMNVAVMVNQSDGQGHKKENVLAITKVWIDSDEAGKVTLKQLKELTLPPHFIVRTSTGRLHAYWKIKGCSVNQFSAIQKNLAAHFGSDPSVNDACRMMRLPGTINWNHTPPFLTKILYYSDECQPVSLISLTKKLGLKLGITTSKSLDENVSNTANLLTAELEKRILDALALIPSDARQDWLMVGMSIHSVAPDQRGYEIWTGWAKSSHNFNEADQKSTWAGFGSTSGRTIASLFYLASTRRKGKMGMDEMDLANLFADECAGKLCFEPNEKQWYAFNGIKWEPNNHKAEMTMSDLVKELSEGSAKADKTVTHFRSRARIRAVTSTAELIPSLFVKQTDFDKNKNDLTVENGVIDLLTGTFRKARSEDYLRRCADVSFDESSQCPRWLKFLDEVTCGDKKLAIYIRTALGYTLFGHADSQVVFLPIGKGGNGKGVLMRTIAAILGTYAKSFPPNLLSTAYSGNVNAPTPVTAGLLGMRMGIVTESQKDRDFDHAFIKQYAGGDEITARPGYGEPITFKPEGKLWISSNKIPEISADDDAMWRRLKPIPFNATFTRGTNLDEKLETALLAERAGILNWMLRGARSYVKNGLSDCEAVSNCITHLRGQSDTLLQWIATRCLVEAGSTIKANDAYDSYCGFAAGEKRVPLSIKKFSDRLISAGYRRQKTNKWNLYHGLKLKS